MKSILFYDAVGSTYDAPQGPIGTEQNVALLADELASRHGFEVQVATKTSRRTNDGLIDYVSLDGCWRIVDVLVHMRYGDFPTNIRCGQRILFCTDSADIQIGGYDKYDAKFRRTTDLVVVAAWQLELFRQRGLTGWRSEHVIPGILPASILAKATMPPKYPHRFVYASAARKGLVETLRMWHELVPRMPPDAELVVTSPGYDVQEAERLLNDVRGWRQVRWAGVLPSMGDVAELITESAGLFYVNTYPECTSITLAMCEALGRRVHLFCKNGFGGVKETIRSPLVTNDANYFVREFFGALREPNDSWLGKPFDFSAEKVGEAWYDTIKSWWTRSDLPGSVGFKEFRPPPDDPYNTFVEKTVQKIRSLPSVDFPLANVLERSDLSRTGMWLEFGVFKGDSLRKLVAAKGGYETSATVFGFDSFKGLPEDWKAGLPKGSFALGEPPVVDGASLVVGLFEETLPNFHFTEPVTLVHVDCDIGSAAQTALKAVVPHLANEAFIVFDELWNYDGFEKHEMRALYDQLIEAGLRVEFLCRSPWEQVSCRVTRVQPLQDKRIAVIIPCFKQAHFLREAFESVRAQTVPPHEIIVVVGDDESSVVAGTLQCKVVHDPGWGLAHARNLGIAATDCPLLFCVDADDTIDPTCLEKMGAEVKDDRTIVASYMQEFGTSNGFLKPDEEMLARGYTSPMCLFTRKLWELTGGFDVASPIEDWAFWLDCHRHQPTLKLVKEVLVHRRMHPAQMTATDPYNEFRAATEYLRPWLFPRPAQEHVFPQEWIAKRLEHFPDNASLKSLVRLPLPENKQLGLCMIVRNESKIIERCLKSVLPIIKYWTIVDTGSTDGTQDIIRRVLQDVPGELHERPWKDFASNRNEAIELAAGKTSHVFMIDADDVFRLEPGCRLPELTQDCYRILVVHGDLLHYRPQVFRPEKFKYVGVLHEYLDPASPDIRIDGMSIQIVGGGHRNESSKKNKFIRDARVLKEALEKEPGNARYTFYLAQSWRDAYRCTSNVDHLVHALKWYGKRAKMGGIAEEVYLSLFEVARCHEMLGHDASIVERAYLAAYENRSFRAEPLFYLARWLRMKHNNHSRAVVYARHAAALDTPTGEGLFVEHAIYDWWAADEFAVAASWIPVLHEECRKACKHLLKCAPEREHERIRGMLKLVGG